MGVIARDWGLRLRLWFRVRSKVDRETIDRDLANAHLHSFTNILVARYMHGREGLHQHSSSFGSVCMVAGCTAVVMSRVCLAFFLKHAFLILIFILFFSMLL